MSTTSETKLAALHYAEGFGWKVLPVHRPLETGRCSCGSTACDDIGKHPIPKLGLKAATNDLTTIRAWWEQYPDANLGVYMKGSGLVGLDIDVQHGGRVQDLPLSAAARVTPTVRTGGGGYHLYYEASPNLNISQSTKLMPPGIDIRSEGYVIAPLSLHHTGQRYAWLAGREPWTLPPLPLPDALWPLLKITTCPVETEQAPLAVGLLATPPGGEQHPYVNAILSRELEKLAQAQEGHRNNALNAAAFSLGQCVGAGFLSYTEVETLLVQVARRLGLQNREIYKTIHSGLNAGIKQPRQRWPDNLRGQPREARKKRVYEEESNY